eukprot:940941-Rhodomonas_salina.2
MVTRVCRLIRRSLVPVPGYPSTRVDLYPGIPTVPDPHFKLKTSRAKTSHRVLSRKVCGSPRNKPPPLQIWSSTVDSCVRVPYSRISPGLIRPAPGTAIVCRVFKTEVYGKDIVVLYQQQYFLAGDKVRKPPSDTVIPSEIKYKSRRKATTVLQFVRRSKVLVFDHAPPQQRN